MVDKNQYLIGLSETLCPLVWDAPLAALSSEEQAFVCVYELEREVNNGGFEQFFRNSPGQYALETVDALLTIGAARMAEITRHAITAAFPDGAVPEDQDDRSDLIDAAGDTLGERLVGLDEKFYEYPDDLTGMLFEYVQANKKAIRGAGPV